MVKLIVTEDGSHSAYSEEYGSSYHSRFGAVQESVHVYVEQGLHFLSPTKHEVKLLEMGFGTGLNAWLTLLEAEKLGLHVQYTAVELHPLGAAFTDLMVLPNSNEVGKDYFHAIHSAGWGGGEVRISPYFTLIKLQKAFEDYDPGEAFDLIYYDAFGPETQAHLWEEPMMLKMAEALRPGGALVTFCAKGSFKRALKAAGLMVERLPGPPGKREMTRAVKP